MEEMVESDIKVEFPVPLDNDRVQFLIYDTPGTDSNNIKHQNILCDVLEEQTQSILIFVCTPDKLEGSGNNILLDYLKGKEKNIDINRSIFVINKADTVCADARENMFQSEEDIQSEEDKVKLELKGKKVFFTSALYGYVAKAVKNGIASKEEEFTLESGIRDLANDGSPKRYCYKSNRYASSEAATEVMIQKCDNALKQARKNNDMKEIVSICSGMYALESEILQYGEKYASAVKVFAIINSVDMALTTLTKRLESIEMSCRQNIGDIDDVIQRLKDDFEKSINDEYKKKIPPKGESISEDTKKRLEIDRDTLLTWFETTIGELNKTISKGKLKVNEKNQMEIIEKINGYMRTFENNFSGQRKKLLESECADFSKKVFDIIDKSENIPQTVKALFKDISNSKIPPFNKKDKLHSIYEKNEKKFFWRKKLNKKSFISAVTDFLYGEIAELTEAYEKEYKDTLKDLLDNIMKEVKENIDQYSHDLKSWQSNKAKMQKTLEKMKATSEELKDRIDKFNKEIGGTC
jgi:hypothetical protein